jgi:hypothetical protein
MAQLPAGAHKQGEDQLIDTQARFANEFAQGAGLAQTPQAMNGKLSAVCFHRIILVLKRPLQSRKWNLSLLKKLAR